MEDQVIRVPIRPLTPQAFEKYGKVLENGKPIYPDVGEDQLEVALVDLRLRPEKITTMAFHDDYNQSFVALKGSMVMLVTLPKSDAKPGDSIDYVNLAAFLFETGDAALIDKGVGHFAVSVGPECQFVNVTRKHRPEQREITDVIEGRGGRMTSRAGIEFVEFGKADNRAVEIEFQAN